MLNHCIAVATAIANDDKTHNFIEKHIKILTFGISVSAIHNPSSTNFENRRISGQKFFTWHFFCLTKINLFLTSELNYVLSLSRKSIKGIWQLWVPICREMSSVHTYTISTQTVRNMNVFSLPSTEQNTGVPKSIFISFFFSKQILRMKNFFFVEISFYFKKGNVKPTISDLKTFNAIYQIV